MVQNRQTHKIDSLQSISLNTADIQGIFRSPAILSLPLQSQPLVCGRNLLLSRSVLCTSQPISKAFEGLALREI